jgi:hypothetical protein
MSWVRAQMEYAKSNARASSIAPPTRAKKDQDVDMGNIVEEAGCDDLMIANMQAECGRRAAIGDWPAMEHLANAICAITKGKGKGKGSSKGKGKGFSGGGWPTPYSSTPSATDDGSKGGSKGGKAGGGKGGRGGTFDGTCNHCGKHGHRKNECRALDAEMAAKRGLNYVDEKGDDVVEEILAGAPPGEDADMWWMGATYSLVPEAPCMLRRAAPSEKIKTSNRFDALRSGEHEGASKGTQSSALASVSVTTAGRVMKKKRQYTRFDDSMAFLQAERAGGESDSDDAALYAMGVQTPGAVLIEAVVDSGAADPVARAGTFSGKVGPSAMSKAGRKYRGPDGTRIVNEGQQSVHFTSDEGHRCGMTWQIADVERPLIAVSHLSAAGNKVVFTKTGGEIVNNATGKTIRIQRKGGVYVLRMWVPGPTPPSKTSDFTRQASRC